MNIANTSDKFSHSQTSKKKLKKKSNSVPKSSQCGWSEGLLAINVGGFLDHCNNTYIYLSRKKTFSPSQWKNDNLFMVMPTQISLRKA